MDKESIWQEFIQLPPEGQRQVVDFIALLRERYGRPRSVKKDHPELAQQAFIGVWSDREDMQDSTGWVREVRKREWMKWRA